MLEVRNLSVGHGDRILVRDVSFGLSRGECVLLAGPNGSGKTSLLKALPSAKAVLIPTGIPKVKGFTVEGFIRTGCYTESDWRGRIPEEAVRRMDAALDLLGIRDLRDRDISTLSDGEFQKACLATGLTRQAETLLLDEPTAFLDVENRQSVLLALRDIARKTGTAVLFSSHDLHDALRVSDRIFALTRDGRFLCAPADRCGDILREAFPGLDPGCLAGERNFV